MKLDQRVIPFEVKSSSESETEGYSFTGLGSFYNNLDWLGDIVAPGAFDQDLAFTRREGKIRDEHGVTTGRIAEAKSVESGLYIEGLILPTSNGKDQYILVKGRAITKLSMGYTTLKRRYLESAEEVKSYWESVGHTPSEDELMMLGNLGYARLIERARVYEVSTTWLPVNENASILTVKSRGERASRRTFADHSAEALAAVEEVIARAEGVRTLRSQEGRGLSVKSLAQLRQLHGRLSTLLTATEPAGSEGADDMALYDQFLAIGARLNGA